MDFLLLFMDEELRFVLLEILMFFGFNVFVILELSLFEFLLFLIEDELEIMWEIVFLLDFSFISGDLVSLRSVINCYS